MSHPDPATIPLPPSGQGSNISILAAQDDVAQEVEVIPGDQDSQEPLHLAHPAPTFERVEERFWKFGLHFPGFRWERQTGGQTQCIRCVVQTASSIAFGLGQTAHTPMYPGGPTHGARLEREFHGPSGQLYSMAFAVDFGEGPGIGPFLPNVTYDVSKIGTVQNCHYVVLGHFSRTNGIPRERIIFVKSQKILFRYFFWAILRLRGFGGLLSLKDVKGFSLYKCDWETGAHKRVQLDQQGMTDMRLLLWAYKSWWRPSRVDEGWTKWIHETLNISSDDPRAGTPGQALSIEVVLGWSTFRITVVILVPVLLSLAVGIWFNSRDWTDLSTIQTAWGIASYVATAGGLVAALLAIASAIPDNS